MVKLPAVGQYISFNEDLEIENEDGYIFTVKAGTPVKVVEQDGDTFENQYAATGTIAFGAEIGDVEVHNQFDRSGQSDRTENVGLHWFDIEPEEITVID